MSISMYFNMIPVPMITPLRGIGEYLRDPARWLVLFWIQLWTQVIMFGPLLLLCVSVIVGMCGWWRRRCRFRLQNGARLITVLVPPSVDPAGGQALWSQLTGLLRPSWRRLLTGQPHLVIEYVFTPTGVAIQIWVPAMVPPGLVEQAIHAAWPGSHTATRDATPLLPPMVSGQRRLLAGGILRLARGQALPIRNGSEPDPLRAILGAVEPLKDKEFACVQILARPVTHTRVAGLRQAGHSMLARLGTGLLIELLDLLTFQPSSSSRSQHPSPITPTRQQNPQNTVEQSSHTRAIVAKRRGAHYDTLIRYVATAQVPISADRSTLRAVRAMLRGRAHALATAFATVTDLNHYRRRYLHRAEKTLNGRWFRRGDVLSIPELAALAHLPADAVPGMQRAGARAIAPPATIATSGPDTKPLGVADAGRPRPIALSVADARQHLHVLGATGSGKSTLLAQMILADANAGRGVVVIDPKGDLATDVLERLPKSAIGKVVLFDADSRTRPPCLNPLDGGDTDMVVDNLVSVFRRVYAAYWGPRTDDLMRASCLTLRLHPTGASLADLPTLLGDAAYRARLTANITDPVLRGFWQWYEDLTEAARSQAIAPLLNKLRALLLRPFIRDALAGGASTVNMAEVLDGGICLVRIPKGSLGEETARLFGSLIVARTWQTAMARAQLPHAQRRDASLLIDECHNFLNLPYPMEDMLAEARGLKLAITLAHQNLRQLPRDLHEGISANARNKIFFVASPEDARDLARHTAPLLTEHDLAHLGRYHVAARLIVDGETTTPFTLRTTPLPTATPGRAKEIRAGARPAAPTRSNSVSSRTARTRGIDPRRR